MKTTNEIEKQLARKADAYIEENKPWELKKSDPEKLQKVLSNLLEALRHLAWLLRPFMPNTSEIILTHLKQDIKGNFADNNKWGLLTGTQLFEKVEPLFPRIDK